MSKLTFWYSNFAFKIENSEFKSLKRMRLSSFLSFSVLNAANLTDKNDLTNSQLAEIKEKYCLGQAKTGGKNSFCQKDDEIPDWIWEIHFASVQYCKDFYRDFHGVEDPRKTSNKFLAAGGQGMVGLTLRD